MNISAKSILKILVFWKFFQLIRNGHNARKRCSNLSSSELMCSLMKDSYINISKAFSSSLVERIGTSTILNSFVPIKQIAEAKGLKSTRSLRLEINKLESKYISREVKWWILKFIWRIKMKRTFIRTKNVKWFVGLMDELQKLPPNIPKLALVYGEHGLGKTHSIIWWATRNDTKK